MLRCPCGESHIRPMRKDDSNQSIEISTTLRQREMDEPILIRADIILDAADLGNTIITRPKTSTLRLQPPQNEANGCCVLAGESAIRKDVIAFSSKCEIIQMQTDCATVEVNKQDMWSLPDEMSKEEAALHLVALLQATSIVALTLGLTFGEVGKTSTAQSEFGRFVVVGSETPLGAAIVQVLSRILDSPRIYVTAVMEDQEELFQRVAHLMKLGAIYAIDGAFPDLQDHLESIRDEYCQAIVIKATADYEIRPEILEAVEGRSTILRCDALDSQDINLTGLSDSAQFRLLMHELLEQVAEAFAIYQEPPSCGFNQG